MILSPTTSHHITWSAVPLLSHPAFLPSQATARQRGRGFIDVLGRSHVLARWKDEACIHAWEGVSEYLFCCVVWEERVWGLK